MSAHPYGRWVILAAAGISATLLVGLIAAYLAQQPVAPPQEAATVPKEAPVASMPPSLDCAFHNFTRTAAVVSFYFDVDLQNAAAPRFFERAIIAGDGMRTNFAGDQRPAWTYGPDSDGKPMITSPDGATRIVLYGLKLGAGGVSLLEAGIRSNVYRNLGGECRQTNLGRG
jgi:hypothetical protein